MINKNIIFDWFTIFKFDDNLLLGKPRKFTKQFIKKLIRWGWRVYIFRPNMPFIPPYTLRRKVRKSGIPVFEVLYGTHSLNRLPFKRGVYIDVAYFYLIGGFWLFLWLKCLLSLKKIGG